MRRFLTIMVMIMTAVGIVACGKNYTWHQKLTVTVGTPDGLKTGTAVSRVTANVGQQYVPGDNRYLSLGFGGEATIVDLGNGKYLFALLSNATSLENTQSLANYTFPELQSTDPYVPAIDAATKTYSSYVPPLGPKPVPAKNYPTLITFINLNDPKSVKLLDPADLAATFGEGYNLKSITLEITDEDVTTGQIEQLLKWLSQKNLSFIDWTKYPADHPLRNINKRSFKTKG